MAVWSISRTHTEPLEQCGFHDHACVCWCTAGWTWPVLALCSHGSFHRVLISPWQRQYLPMHHHSACSAPVLPGAPKGCGPRDCFVAAMSGGNCQNHVSRVWPLGFSSLGTGASALLRVGLRLPRWEGWLWLANPPETILLDSKLHLCC